MDDPLGAAQPGRDMVGYGRAGKAAAWPGGARVAVSIVVNYEEGSERSFPAGDEANEPPLEFAYPQPPIRDLHNESAFEYGSRAGVWRLQRIFDEYGVDVTFFACAMAFELNPEVAAYVAESNHEVCCHGLRWDVPALQSRETERERLIAAIASLEATTGKRPTGWYSKSPMSLSTRELIVEQGFTYDSDSFADDVPFFVEVSGRDHLVLPYTQITNDARLLHGQGIPSPSVLLEHCMRAFDCLFEEGATRPKMMTLALHPRIIGHPSRAGIVREFIEHCTAKGAWIARRCDIAAHWLEQERGA